MADRSKFEEVLERLINEDKDGAEALFHELIVEKSREIYEGLLEEEDEDIEETEDNDDDDMDESADEDDDDSVEEGFNLDEFEVEADPMGDMGGDPTDDFAGDIDLDGGDDMGDDDMGDEGDVEDRVSDLEDELEALKADFEKMMAGEENEPEHDDMELDLGGDDEGDDEDEDEDEDEKEEAYSFESKGSAKSEAEQMREYVEKIGGGPDYTKFGKMGDNGANTKSPVAGKNDMGGTAGNLNQGKDNEAGDHAGLGELKAKPQDAGNVNVPGGKAGKSLKAQPKGHGAEKKATGDNGANKTSPISGLKTRAK